MIGMPRQDRDGSVDLLHKHNADELMRPSRRAEGDGKARFFPQARRQSVGGADNEQHDQSDHLRKDREIDEGFEIDALGIDVDLRLDFGVDREYLRVLLHRAKQARSGRGNTRSATERGCVRGIDRLHRGPWDRYHSW